MFYALRFSVDSNKKKHSHGSASGTATPRKTSAEFRMTSSGPHGEEISLCRPGEKVEYFFASDASAIIEHTNRYSVIQIAYFILFFINYQEFYPNFFLLVGSFSWRTTMWPQCHQECCPSTEFQGTLTKTTQSPGNLALCY